MNTFYVGKQHGKWTLLAPVIVHVRTKGWRIRCVCGIEREPAASELRKTFGCVACRDGNVRHGGSKRPEYTTWASIKQRCFNKNSPAYPSYGGRGITMYSEWITDFAAFFAYVGEKPTPEHSLDRIDNDGNYEPGNVRWATQTEQANNTRVNVIVEHGGRKQTLKQWARELGLNNRTLWFRYHAGYRGAELFSTESLLKRRCPTPVPGKFKGVYENPTCRGRFVAHIKLNGRKQNLGSFGSPIEAARAFDTAARAAGRPERSLNFPETADTIHEILERHRKQNGRQ